MAFTETISLFFFNLNARSVGWNAKWKRFCRDLANSANQRKRGVVETKKEKK